MYPADRMFSLAIVGKKTEALPHMNFPALGRLRKQGSGYSWSPVVFTDQWDKR
jgi:hypothetical protein